MANKYTTSVNIIRDSNRELNYIPTPNSVKAVNQICNDFKKGTRSFNIIGSYGTGKSSFLWALQQSVIGRKKHFQINLISNPTVEFINIVGEFKSIKDAFADFFNVKNNTNLSENIFSEIYNKYHELGKKSPLLFIVIDEFGKFLEYASQNEPEKELYFIQQLAEFANNPDKNIILITTVHQNFDAYAYALSNQQKQEWTKVKGRFREITFNEPVEQLLFLASEHLSNIKHDASAKKTINQSIELFIKSKVSNTSSKYLNEIAQRLYPLDVFSANIITSSLQKYGQNERSLFSFLESTDETGISKHIEGEDTFFHIAKVYDYLTYNFYTFINSRYNPDFASWKAIINGLDEVERAFDKNINVYTDIIKVIGLLNISASSGAIIDKSFLANYLKLCLEIKNPESFIEELEKKRIILYRNYSKRYILFEGTDLDIQSALIEAGNKVSDVTDISTLINKYYQLPPIIAKEVSYLKGTPRLFEYKISEYPISDVPFGEIDGFVNLIFNDKIKLEEIIEKSLNEKEAILYCYYKNSKSIKDLLFEIEKTRKVIEENDGDKVAVRELNNIVSHQQNLLNHKILNNFNSNRKEVVWVFNGETVDINSKKEFNKRLSKICIEVYDKTPIFNNELVNKHKISTSIHTAKRNFFKALCYNWNKPDLDFPADKFPPEKTIYLSLLKENGIELFSDNIKNEIKVNRKNHFNHLWSASQEFLDSAKISRRNLAELNDLLSKRPYKLKQGLIDFWLPSFLFINRDNFALFNDSSYIPVINEEVLELLAKNPEQYEIKTFGIEGVKLDIFNSYRLFLNQDSKEQITNSSFIETIKPFLVFYKGLPEYSKTTKRFDNRDAISIREAIAGSKDPEQTFFEDFPNALGTSMEKLQKSKTELKAYTIKLQEAIKALRTSFDELINRIEQFIQDEIVSENIPFEAYKEQLQNRYKKLRRHLLLPAQRTFVQRLDSQIDDKKAWLNSLTQALTGNTLEKLKDEDEIIIKDKFKEMILELDSLTNISKADYAEDKEDIVSLEINSFFENTKKTLVRLPKNKKNEVNAIQLKIEEILSKDKTLNIAALTNVLKDIINK
jgi:hypothetical protein